MHVGVAVRGWVWTVVLAVVAAVGCGGAEPIPPLTSSGWLVDELGTSVDGQTAVAMVSRDDIVALTVTDAGVVEGWRSQDGEAFESMRVEGTAVEGLYLTDVVVRGSQAVAIGSSAVDRRPRVFSSIDGGPWLEVVTTGFDGPALAEDIVATDDGFVVVGSRPGEVGAPPRESSAFVPVAWRSWDARTWTESVLPFGGEGGATGVTAIGGDLIVVGPSAPADLIWRSSDHGTTWGLVTADVPGVGPGFRLHDIATGRGVVMAIGTSLAPARSASVVVRSIDGGRTWGRATGADGLDSGRHPARLAAGMSGFTIATSRADGRSVVLRSTNGDVWHELDLREVVGVERVDDMAAHPSGRMVVFGRSVDGSWSAWTWPDGPALPPTVARPPD